MWSNVEKNVDITEEQFFGIWEFLERRWNGIGGVGLSVHTHPVRDVAKFGPVDLTMTTILYRNEDGELLCSYTTYTVDGQLKPYWMYVHPDHQRKGIATLVMNHSLSLQPNGGTGFDFIAAAQGAEATEAMANFTNKFVNNYLYKNNPSATVIVLEEGNEI